MSEFIVDMMFFFLGGLSVVLLIAVYYGAGPKE